jgi:cell wall-associated NlpC family hydrolase
MRPLEQKHRDPGRDRREPAQPTPTGPSADTDVDIDTAGFAAVGVLVAVPLLTVVVLVLVLVLVGGGGGAQALPGGCGGAGTATTIGTATLDAEQLTNAQTIVSLAAGRRLPPYAAVIAIATAYQESKLHNLLTQVDHDSIGLFQLRVSLWGAPVAADPVRSTGWFLDHLVRVPDWQSLPLTVAAQTVQRSAFPDAYAPWQSLAAGVVGQLWPTAAATAATAATADSPTAAAASTAPGSSPTTKALTGLTDSTVPPLCPQIGDGVPLSAGGTASTTVPTGLRISGSPAGIIAATFALAQLGKPYLWAAAGPDSYDCSGLTMAAWARAGTALAHFTGDQVSAGTPGPTNLSQAAAGDLVFIPGSDGTPTAPRHVGMVVGYLQQRDGRHLLIASAPRSGQPVQLIDARRWAGLIVAVRHIA